MRSVNITISENLPARYAQIAEETMSRLSNEVRISSAAAALV
jgi:hypothetical protein